MSMSKQKTKKCILNDYVQLTSKGIQNCYSPVYCKMILEILNWKTPYYDNYVLFMLNGIIYRWCSRRHFRKIINDAYLHELLNKTSPLIIIYIFFTRWQVSYFYKVFTRWRLTSCSGWYPGNTLPGEPGQFHEARPRRVVWLWEPE